MGDILRDQLAGGDKPGTGSDAVSIVVALDEDPVCFDAVARALVGAPWKLLPLRRGDSVDSLLESPDVAAIIAGAACDPAVREIAAERRLPLIAVEERFDCNRALGAIRSGVSDWLSVDQLELLPEILRREVVNRPKDRELERDVSRLAVALVANVDQPSRLEEYARGIAAAVDAPFVLVLVAESSGELTAAAQCDLLGVATSQTHSPLRANEVAAMAAASREAGARTQHRFGVPGEWPRHWTSLSAGGRLVGMQLLARPGEAFTAREADAIDRVAAVLSLAIDRGHAIARLRRADSVKTEFVRTISHELRTPLNTVIGYADLLSEEAFGPLGDEQRRILRRVGDRARGLLEVIAATLDLPGIDGGRLSLETRSVAVSELLRELEADAREWRVRHDLRYQWDVAADLPAITTDPGKLRVLLKNLIANAVKFTDRGGITVRARARDGGVEFSVEDTGIGIEPEAVHFVFDAFRQASAAATGQYGGVGLGLYIVRRLVGILGGRLRVESEIGVGSKFHVWLPADLG